MSFSPFTWNDDDRPVLGEGISRTSNSKAKLHEIRVLFTGAPSIKEFLRAENKKQALKFAKNRHPQAIQIDYIKSHKLI